MFHQFAAGDAEQVVKGRMDAIGIPFADAEYEIAFREDPVDPLTVLSCTTKLLVVMSAVLQEMRKARASFRP